MLTSQSERCVGCPVGRSTLFYIMDNEPETWIALLLNDSSFPGGSLANSQGLESAMLHGVVNKGDNPSLLMYINLSLEQTVHSTLPFVRTAHDLGYAAHAFGTSGSPIADAQTIRTLLYSLDMYCHAFLSNEISRRASINQGKCFIRVVQHAFPTILSYLDSILSPSLRDNTNTMHMHYAPIFGLVCKYLGLSMESCVRVYLRMFLRDLVSAAIRLNLLGPLDGVKLQVQLFPVLEELLQPHTCVNNKNLACCSVGSGESTKYSNDESGSTRMETVFPMQSEMFTSGISVQFYKGIMPTQTAPIVDVLQSRHDMLYSRLFSS